MDDKRKKIIYLSFMFVLSIAFISLYILDNNMTKSQGDDAFTVLYDTLEPTIKNNQDENDSQDLQKSESTYSYEQIQIIDWDENKIDSVEVFSQRKDYTLIHHGPRKWSIRSERLDEKIPKTNRAIFKLTNIFTHMITDNNLTKDYSEFAKYFEYPICTVISNFKDGTKEKLTFIRIAQVNETSNEVEMKTWVRVNEETVVYATTYNTLERFLVAEKEFLKIY